MIDQKNFREFFELVVNRTDVWLQQNYTGNYRTRIRDQTDFQELTPDVISRHLSGEITCALPPLDRDGLCKWAAWDDDTNSDVLDRIENTLRKLKLNPLREGRRAGRSGHLWLFFDQQMGAEDLITFNGWLRSQLGYSLEFFPKQAIPGKSGNGLRIPFGKNLKPAALGARGWFDGQPEDVALQLEWLLAQPKSEAAIVKKIAKRIDRLNSNQFQIIRTKTYRKEKSDFDIWAHVSSTRQIGSEAVTQCPICESEGHDKSRDNLHILKDGSFLCMYQSPGITHPAKKIQEALISK
jgi:hypothetical protein